MNISDFFVAFDPSRLKQLDSIVGVYSFLYHLVIQHGNGKDPNQFDHFTMTHPIPLL